MNGGGGNENQDEDDFYTGVTCWHLACGQHHVEGVKWLLEHGADIDLPDDQGDTPLIVTFFGDPDHDIDPPDNQDGLEVRTLLLDAASNQGFVWSYS